MIAYLRSLFAEKGSIFGYEHSGNLSLFRLLYCFQLALTVGLLSPSWFEFYAAREYYASPLFAMVSSEPLPFEWFRVLSIALVGTLVAAAIGVFTRPALWISAVLFVLVEGTELGFTRPRDSDYTYHLSNLTVFFLFILAMAPGIDRHTLRSVRVGDKPTALPEWPRKAMIGMLAAAYFGAGYQRMIANPMWIDGSTLQAYLLDKHMRYDLAAGYWLAQHYWLCIATSVFTILLELGYFLVLFYPRLKPYFLVGGLMLHLMIYVTMKINFFIYFVPNYLVLIEWKWIVAAWAWIKRIPARVQEIATPAEPVPMKHRAVCLLWIGMQTACVFIGVEKWPFSDFRVFRDRRVPEKMSMLYFSSAVDEAKGRDGLLWRKQHQLRRVMTSEPERLIRDSESAAPEEKERMLEAARQQIRKAVLESDPEMFDRKGSLKVYEKRVKRDPESGELTIAERFVFEVGKSGGE